MCKNQSLRHFFSHRIGGWLHGCGGCRVAMTMALCWVLVLSLRKCRLGTIMAAHKNHPLAPRQNIAGS